MDVDQCGASGRGGEEDDEKFALADVMVARESDYGVNDEVLMCVSHLGRLLQVGDVVEGYDLTTSVYDEESIKDNFIASFDMPDVVLVRKTKSGGADAAAETEEEAQQSAVEKKKSRRAKKKAAMKSSKENKGRGYRGVKKQNKFEGHLDMMGFAADADERRALAAEDEEGEEGEEDDELRDEIEAAEADLASEVVGGVGEGGGGGGEEGDEDYKGGVETEEATFG
jgi:nonsense-mediated mRNA decay protein 3